MSFQQQHTPAVKFDDWLKAWRSWAGTRKRGKMAQFIVHKLEENKQAMWLDITKGKFQLTEWHTIAEEWFKQKPRSSDQVDAPCMLRKGLPRAFPGLDEVKSESIKEGTQYRSRVFQAPQTLLQEVVLYINKPMYNATFVPNGQTSAGVFQPSMYNPPQTHIPTSVSVSTGPIMNGGQPFLSPPIKLEEQIDAFVNSPVSNDSSHSPYNGDTYQQTQYLIGGDGLPDGAGGSPYGNGGSPYSHEGPSPVNGAFPISTATGMTEMLQIPASEADAWSNPGNYSPVNSEYYSRSPEAAYQQPISPGYTVEMASNISIQSPGPIVSLQVQPFPAQSPLEGGGQLALLFSGELPPGSKWLSFISQARPAYMHQVEAVQGHDPMALTAIIPKHDIPESVTLQVSSNGQLVAQTEFTYYANAQYNSDMLFHYLTHQFPQYFPDVSMDGGMDLGQGDVGGANGNGYYYSGNIPPTSYSLLLGACRLGIEPLVIATLELASMAKINSKQLRKAMGLADENGHSNMGKLLKTLAEVNEIVSKGEDGEKMAAIHTEEGRQAIKHLEQPRDPKDCADKVLSRLSSIHRMEAGIKDTDPPTPTTPTEQLKTPTEFRRSSSNKLTRQENREDEDLLSLPPTNEKHSRGSIAECDDTVPPLTARPRVEGRKGRKMLIATHSDAADSAVSMSFDGDSSEYSAEVARRRSAQDALLGLYQFNKDSDYISVKINADTGYTLSSSLQYECLYQVTGDYPPSSDPSNIIFRTGDKIVQIGDTSVKDKGPDDFALLLQTEACEGTSIRIIPRLSPPPSTNASLSLGYSSLEMSERPSICSRPSEQQLASSVTMKVSNLLSMKPPGPKRIVTIPRSSDGYGFKLTGGNAVGLFVSDVAAGRDEIKVGDQVLEIAGESTLEMTYFASQDLLKKAKDKVQLKVMENNAKFQAIMLQFELESFYIRTCVDHTPSDSKDMTLQEGGIARVVNCSHDPNYWLAWSVDNSTGADTVLRRIPAPHKAHSQFGKHVYETISTGDVQDLVTAT
ncbi:uncharacterized protein LOC135343497 [Halichondria panicea]|uniref:uncharacterized protein LOC135343497 n=1 Tax=Halichondria panicea TaxID=6063 RepID=UPI00312B52F2